MNQVTEKMVEINHQSAEYQIDLICVLDEGLIVNYDKSKDRLVFPYEPGCEFRVRPGNPDENLRLLYLMLMRILTQVWIRPIRILDYYEG